MLSELLPACNDHRTVLGINLDHDTSTLCLLACDERRSASAKRVIDRFAHLGAVENQFPQESHGLHCRMKRTARGLWSEEYGLVLSTPEVMSAMPPIEDEFMLWKVVESPYDRTILHPNDELGYLQLEFHECLSQGEDHLVGVEDVDAVLLLKEGKHRGEPCFGECGVFRITHKPIIRNILVLRDFNNVALALHIVDGVRWVGEDEMHRSADDARKGNRGRITANKDMVAKGYHIPSLNQSLTLCVQ